jgi:hypothetical protein
MTDGGLADYDPRGFIQAQTWKFAKSVPQHPHWYLPAERATDFEDFKTMCAWVNRTGTPATFEGDGKGHRYKYAGPIDGWLYWVSRSPWGRSILLNRRQVTPAPDPQLRLDV